jgi:hypothetical protein
MRADIILSCKYRFHLVLYLGLVGRGRANLRTNVKFSPQQIAEGNLGVSFRQLNCDYRHGEQ